MSRTHENGTVTRLFRWPVKSMAGEPVDALRVDARGAGGDRTHALWDTSRDRLLTARQAPGMLRWRAAYPGVAGDALGLEHVAGQGLPAIDLDGLRRLLVGHEHPDLALVADTLATYKQLRQVEVVDAIVMACAAALP